MFKEAKLPFVGSSPTSATTKTDTKRCLFFYFLFRLEPTSGSPERRKPFWGEEEQRNERAFVFYTEASDMQLVTTKRTNGDKTPGAILRAGTTFGKSGKIKRKNQSK